jgi:hypothetical protein
VTVRESGHEKFSTLTLKIGAFHHHPATPAGHNRSMEDFNHSIGGGVGLPAAFLAYRN